MSDAETTGAKKRVNVGFLAVTAGGILHAKTKRELRLQMESQDFQDATIIKGRVLEKKVVTKVSF
ncbi:MAG: hypothetical protein RLZZ74_3466 [Cyanobacteriota bacterium]|jgi:hypothetical protein